MSHKRLRRTPAGEIVLQLKTPYRYGTTHLVMTPLEFLQRLAALVPRPRLHLIRFHGVLAPNAALRPQIVPGDRDQTVASTTEPSELPPASTQARLSWAQLLKRVFAIDLTTCPQCGGPLTLIAAIEEPAVIAKILAHLGLPTRAPPRAAARVRSARTQGGQVSVSAVGQLSFGRNHEQQWTSEYWVRECYHDADTEAKQKEHRIQNTIQRMESYIIKQAN